MLNTVLTEQMYKIITAHLSYIEREKDEIIKSYYTDSAEAGMGIETFFREYTGTLEKYLSSTKVKKDAPDVCPPAIIGSTVEVRDLEDNEIYGYHIVLPYPNKTVRDMNSASCLSPMGRALLMKTVGRKVEIKTPTGALNYEIVSITLPENEAENGLEDFTHESTGIA